ncbi:hypothetical protein QNO07_16380 [Streptomyces sp. 549]|uniref:hypothetical protein n=1 Tax=Streptomyces sp. 549 TaxID=3049076 RepID=UPI0024C3637A|nr:hypothetical protein [Streptomyces sp. 549]MDK1474974.1 hypothetical protein [Streptomyces sp. 549]
MRIPILVSRLAAAGALSAVAVVGAACPATAGPSDDVNVQPDPVAPGSGFSVYGTQCAGDNGMARFKAPEGGAELPDIDLGMLSNALGGTGTVPAGAPPGSYRVTVLCDGETYFGTLKVADTSSTAAPTDDPTASKPTTPTAPPTTPTEPPAEPSADPGKQHSTAPAEEHSPAPVAPPAEPPANTEHTAVPKGGVETGVGGSNQSANTAAWTAGGALAVALVGGALWYRRRGQV